jgi:hypothetical protein
MSEVLPVAERILSEQHRLRPFGSTLSTDDRIVAVGTAVAAGELDTAAVVAEFRSSFRDGAARGELKATALVYTAQADGPGPSATLVRVALDHRENYSTIVSFPYHFTDAGELSIGEPFGAEGAHEIFEG